VDYPSKFGPWALVVGASTTIGEQFARQLAERGMNVVLVARREPLLRDIAADIDREAGVQTRVVAMDLMADGAVERLADAVADLPIGLLVINANLHKVNLFHNMDLDTKLRTIRMNTEVPVRLVHHFGAQMVERGRGGILLVNALNALTPLEMDGIFQASKAFLMLFGESLWNEYRRHGVQVGVTMVNGIEGSESYEAKLSPTSRLVAKLIGGSMAPERIVRRTLSKFSANRPIIVPDFIIPINRLSVRMMTLARLSHGGLFNRSLSYLFGLLLDGDEVKGALEAEAHSESGAGRKARKDDRQARG
jgi:hypothetical protein